MKEKIAKVIIYVLASFWIFMTIFPLIIAFLCSFKDNIGISLSMFALPEEWLWQNYRDVFFNANMGRAVFNSMYLALMSTLIVIVVGMMAAYVLSRKRLKFLPMTYNLFLLGVMVPLHCAIIPILTMATSFRARNTYWFLILVYAAFNLAQAVFLFVGFLNGIDKELDEAATIDGCNDYQLLFKILFPICTPIISTVAILTFIFGYGELIFSMNLLTNPLKTSISRAMLTFSGAYEVYLGPVFASIIIAVLPMLVFYIIFHEKVQSGMLEGAVKS